MRKPLNGCTVLAHAVLLPAILFAPAARAADPNLTQPNFAQPIEQIVVTATPYASGAGKLATLVGRVSRAEILRAGGANLADALANVPGVTGSGFASGASRPVIRGFDANRVKILENGIGSFDVADVGPDHGTPIDPLPTQKIEVVRGAGTLRFGSQAIGGVVNAINNRVPFAAPEQAVEGEVVGAYAAGADMFEGAASVEARSGQFAFHGDGFGRHAGDYDIPGGVQANSFSRGEGVSLGAAYLGDRAKSGVALIHTGARYGIPAEDAYIDMRQTKGLARSTVAFDRGVFSALNTDVGYADYRHSERDDTGAAASLFTNKEWDTRTEALLTPTGSLSAGAAGLQVQHRRFTALGEGEDYLLPTRTQSAAAFLFAETPIAARLKLQVGGRVELVAVKGTPLGDIATRRAFTPVSGSAGIAFSPDDAVTLGVTLSSAARAPGQTELFARGPHDASRTFERGDPALRTERSTSLEGTFRLALPGVAVEGAAWTAHFDRFIYGALTGRSCDEDGDCVVGDAHELRELVYRQQGARFRGLEGKAVATVAETRRGRLSLDVVADVVRATLSGGTNVPRIPPYRVGLGLAWTANVFSADVRWRYSGKQTKTAVNETPTDGFDSLDARVAWRPLQSRPDVELSLVGRNLTDSTQGNAAAFNKDKVILPGRDLRMMIRTAF